MNSIFKNCVIFFIKVTDDLEDLKGHLIKWNNP